MNHSDLPLSHAANWKLLQYLIEIDVFVVTGYHLSSLFISYIAILYLLAIHDVTIYSCL